jgi:hypothetical protein
MMSDKDSDSDYIDIAEEPLADEDVTEEEGTRRTGRGRGKDIDWIEIARFANNAEYKESEYYKDIEKNFTMRKARETFYADTEHFTCKFARKRNYLKCPIEYKICFMTTLEEVVVTTNCRTHVHKIDDEYQNTGPNLVWTEAQTNIVMRLCKIESSTNRTILRVLQDENAFPEGKLPTSRQLTVKVRHCRSIIRRNVQIFDTHELREKISENNQVPVEDTEGYIAHSEVHDEEDDVEPRFLIIWTSRKLKARINQSLTQDDATYR